MSQINKNKYFKVKKIKSVNGSVIFKVFGYDSFLDMLFGWSYMYQQDNNSLEEAIDQIKYISKVIVIEEKTVYKTKLNLSKPVSS